MPLVILSGLPSSGKTRRAQELKQFFESRLADQSQEQEGSATKTKDYRIHVVNDESLNLNKHVSYNTAADEKKARGALMSAVERLLSKDDIVIVDSLNYIKGFRYQLYCVARAIGTPHCVVFCGCSPDTARQWNSVSGAYPEKIFEELVVRFEEPDSRTKWDSPLFIVVPEDIKLPEDEIWDAVILKKAKPPNMSTVVKVVKETNYLYEFDQTTQNVIQAILDAQKSGDPTKQIKAPLSSILLQLPPTRVVTLSELRRLRRQFTSINKMHTLLDMSRTFTSSLRNTLNTSNPTTSSNLPTQTSLAMSSALDMSLDDVIKTQKANRRNNAPRGGRGARSSGPARNTRHSRDNKPYQAGAQPYRNTAAPLHTAVLRQSAPDGSKMQVSNLDHRVSAEDLKLVFSSRVGPLKKCTLNYDQNGKSTGTAVVHFTRVGDAAVAYSKFNGVPLDGRPMRIEIVLAPAAAQAVLPAQAQGPKTSAPNQGNRNQGPSRGGRGGRGRGRGGRNQGEKRETKTADQLDAEMNDYMQVDA
ncbi:hypothetical protein BGZ79_003681 [Entomortierella chlamydospora]|nr:hypothetical protein BGZ79_003681 [Entomortierella chlamydospora]